jgi:uncharacterized membrane protein YfcA
LLTPVSDILLSSVVGVFAGLVGALVGVGGGVFITPFLTLYMGIPIRESIAASLVAVIATSTAGGSSYVDQRITHVKLAMFLEVATTAGALAGATLAVRLSSWTLFIVFGSVLLYMTYNAMKTLHTDERRISKGDFVSASPDRFAHLLQLEGEYYDASERRTVRYSVKGVRVGSTSSFLAGMISGLLGIGGGAVKVGVMNLYMNVPIKVAVATSKFMIGVTAASGALVFLLSGLVNPYLAAPIALGTTAGATAGTFLMNRVRSSQIKLLFSLLLLYLGYAMLARGLAIGFGIHLPLPGGGGR